MSEPVAALTVLQRWPSFRDSFFGPPNSLRPGSGIAALDEVVATADALIAEDPPKPVVLPARIDGSTHYFALAFTSDQARTLRELLQSHVGRTWTDFDGRSLATSNGSDPLEQAAVAFTGDSRYVYRFRVGRQAAARNWVRESVQTLLASLRSAPRRQARIALPIGRLIGDLTDACAARAEHAAQAAYEVLAADHRLSQANRLFLQIQLLAAFDRWDELEQHPELDTLLRLPRPILASDALARLATSKLADPPDLATFAPIATRFNGLIDSVSAIRSVAGARYYTLWALAADESPDRLRERLAEAGWTSDPGIAALLHTATSNPVRGVEETTEAVDDLRKRARQAIEAGRFDAAIDLLTLLPTDRADLPAVVEAITHTFTAKAVTLLERHRTEHGEDAIRGALGSWRPERPLESAPLPDRLARLFSDSTSPQQLEYLRSSIERSGVAELRAPGGTDAVCRAILQAMDGVGPERLSPGIDVCIDLVRDLKTSDAPIDDVRSLSHRVLELWAYHDNSGDRHRAGRIVQLVGDLVEMGLSVQAYEEVVELVRAGWDPFLANADLPTGLDLLEQFLAHRPEAACNLNTFAAPMLSRIGPHNAARVPSAALAVAVDLAPSFDLALDVPAPSPAVHEQEPSVRPGTRVALYSLQEQALDRTARILRERHPGLDVVICADHVATEGLRAAARSADVFIVMDRAATHAATNALKAERAGMPIRYAAGKGSTSMIEAAETWLRDQHAAGGGPSAAASV
ncbi:protein DpdD [Micromonospora sp. NPDC050187]|uniref:protein DpdD n=1 Tax=Micromonospora sp. NPDC050187 TaxID=3364277 RepID=UPI0037BC31BF